MTGKARRTLLVALLIIGVAGMLGAGSLVARAERTVDKPDDHTSQWQWLHGRAAVKDLKSCQKCHTGDSCTTCHLASWPHPDGFLATHGTEALRLNGRGCYLCHRTSYCDGCHGGVRMPHESGYLSRHIEDSASEDVCLRCHVRSDCDSCHASHGAHRLDGTVR